MPENPVYYKDRRTGKIYDERTVTTRRAKFPEEIKERLSTIIVDIKDPNNIIIEIPNFQIVTHEEYDNYQDLATEEEIIQGKHGERMYEIYEAYPKLFQLNINNINWGGISKDFYTTHAHILTKEDRDRLYDTAEKEYKKVMKGKPKGAKPEIVLYYYKKKRGRGRHDVAYKRIVKYSGLSNGKLILAIAKTLDSIRENIDYYYVVAERYSLLEPGVKEYRNIIRKTII